MYACSSMVIATASGTCPPASMAIARSARWGHAALLLALGLWGCGKAVDPPAHLTLRDVTTRDDGHSAIAALGDGLPRGAEGTLHLDGTWYGPAGTAPQRGDLPCRVGPEGEATVPREALAALALPGSFEGSVSIALTSPDGQTARGGPIAARFAVDGEGGSAAERVLLQRQMQAARRALGVAVEGVPGEGLRVRELAAEGAAARAGVRTGDLLTRLGGVPLLLDSALRLADAPLDAELVYVRAGRTMRARLGAGHGTDAPLPVTSLLVACLIVSLAASLLPGRRRPALSTLQPGALPLLGAAIIAALGAAWGVGLSPLLWLGVAVAPELLHVRSAATRSAALHALAHAVCSVLAYASCVVQASTGAAAEGALLPVLGAPWLWLAWLTLAARPRVPVAVPALREVAGASQAILWAQAAFLFHGADLRERVLGTLAALISYALCTASPRPLGTRAGLAALALLFASWSPALGRGTAALQILGCVVLGVVAGQALRAVVVGGSAWLRGVLAQRAGVAAPREA